jgi:hypothetical protein
VKVQGPRTKEGWLKLPLSNGEPREVQSVSAEARRGFSAAEARRASYGMLRAIRQDRSPSLVSD